MKTYKKIDLYYAGDYLTSTMQSKTCKAAKANFLATAENRLRHYYSLVDTQILKHPEQLKARFDHATIR